MNEEVIRIEDIMYALKKRWIMILSITVAFTLAAAALSFFVIKPKYEAKVKVFIGKEETKGNASNYDNNDIAMYQKLMKTYAEVIKTKDATKSALGKIGQATTQNNVNRVLSGLAVAPSADTQIMEVKYTTTTKSEILPVLNSITEMFIDNSEDLIPNGNIQIIEKAEMPESPISPNKVLNTIIGFMLGMMVAIGIAFLLEYMDNTVRSKDELEKLLDIPVLGNIPKMD
ncbi:Wzz/FepE/Etk N-terminal domain-containing protein [uncultured Clostridium sp.]|jgi:capsular polysaccharide biosynthesis protein|uniref:YveK family protein n=1 Tax=uncultured Clostridium sp. TaxID=59620 RepID=UPI002617A37B|nr:Wzz/FepE/Etk N-terminal domain-containing protein [uncultured Clostridium sp.]